MILYEILTGKRPFQGESVIEMLGAVMNKEPDWTDAPNRIQHLLRSCLQREPKERLQSIGDARLLLTEPHLLKPEGRPAAAAWIPWAAAAIFAMLAVLEWTRMERPAISALQELTCSIVPPTGKNLAAWVDLTRPNFTRRIGGSVSRNGQQIPCTKIELT